MRGLCKRLNEPINAILIPMRGNELLGALAVATIGAGILIPMRGNENESNNETSLH